ncbi:hypothetical protein P20439_2734 [Pseudoalteromonas sp. BSi20439]|nr:hypothetical protein P20439_2734 [Pseudoalteromonas sp. BSi20439]
MLSDALNEYEKVEVNLTGYNRYGPSFISEAFGGLIREEGFRLADIEKKLIVNHELLPSIVEMCWTELKEAEEEVYG